MKKNNILEIEGLVTEFTVGKRVVHAVNGVNLAVERGKTLGIVGESGCGKSVTAHSILQLLPPNGRIAAGEIRFTPDADGKTLVLSDLKKTSDQMRTIRGKDISMIFQDPMTSLNPAYTIGHQIMENLRNHEKISKTDAKKRIIKLLEELGIPAAEQRFNEYPHQFSGGMKQRVMIAIALVCNPNILIADEPTTALDVTIQAQILALMKEIQEKHGTTLMLITHNMGIVAETCDNVAVMYMGHVVEFGTVEQIFENPQHPYTKALMRSVPQLDLDRDVELASIPGSTPDASIAFDHCEFADRCECACERCLRSFPKDTEVEPGHIVRCKLLEEEDDNA